MDSLLLPSFIFLGALWFFLCTWRWRTFAPLLPLFLPTYLIKFLVFGIPFTVLEIFVWITFFVWVLRWLASKEELQDVPSALRWLLILFLGAGTIGLLIVPSSVTLVDGTVFQSTRVALGVWKGWIVVGVLSGWLFGSFLRDPVVRHRALHAWLFSGLFVSVWALAQVWSGFFLTPDGRASGPFISANYLSLYIGPMVVLAFGMAVDAHERRERAFLWTIFVMLVLVLFFSQSYAAWLAVCGSGVLYSVVRFFIFSASKKERRRVLWFSLSGFIVLLSGVVWLQSSSEKFQQLFLFSERSSSAVRLEVWQIAWQLIREYFFGGIGLGQFEAFYQVHAVRILGHVPYEWVMIHPHNLFLATWLGAGLLGVVWLFLVVLVVVHAGIRALRNHHVRLPVRRSIMLAVCVFLVVLFHGFFDTPLWKNDLMVSFWFILAFLFSVPRDERLPA